ncbi:PaaI family thioesterase [Halanaerobium praevalens]|uniref:Acyl-coenzyme A thioesterase THEM4 n=1 Tax=Halanaerobium praevalens (strain ATCC 33744 / DSM 2228 / GSL) TaxID=572479 RepID=E3DPT0_HALPG|nr:PaaI family thioesterase [Halanaerobium praevalens]ADO76755.1 thioesterase superfamily protein [Halanaerobium praevalens DSM 2228]
MNNNEAKMCFACGPENPISLGLKFEEISQNRVRAEFTPTANHQGYTGIIHGGLTATLLDEAMAYVVGFKGIKAFTAELNIRFRKAIEVGKPLEIIGEYKKSKKSSIANIYYTEAKIFDKDGNLKAKAEAKFIEE